MIVYFALPKYIYNNLEYKNLIILGILVRLFVFTAFVFFPFPYGADPPVSALWYQTGTDLALYLPWQYLDGSVDPLREIFRGVQNLFGIEVQVRSIPGPFFPALIWLTDYSPGHTLLLSAVILASEIAAFIIWCKIFKTQLHGVTGLLFCVMPHTIWFGLIVTSDVFFYLFSAVMFYHWSSNDNKYEKNIAKITFLLCLIRPAGLAFSISRLIFLIKKKRISLALSSAYLLIMLSAAIYYLPYFYFVQDVVANIHQKSDGIAGRISDFFDLFGFQGSRSDLFVAYLLRYFYGFIFLLGFLGVLLYDNDYVVPVLVTVIAIILFLFPTWRYLLPILPILYFYGARLLVDGCKIVWRTE